jgi:phosphatidylserine decarboxylase
VRHHPYLAREARPLLYGLLLVALVGQYVGGFSVGLPLMLVTFVTALLFRDPAREIPASPLGIVAPLEGQIVSVAETRDPWLDRDAIRVRLRMSWLNVYSVFSPMEGRVMQHWCQSKAAARSVSKFGTRHTVWIQSDECDDVVMTIAVTHKLGRLRFYFNPGERIGQGQRCGFLYFGGRADLFLPPTADIECQAGQHVVAASAIVAKLVRGSSREAVSG